MFGPQIKVKVDLIGFKILKSFNPSLLSGSKKTNNTDNAGPWRDKWNMRAYSRTQINSQLSSLGFKVWTLEASL